MQCQGNMCQAGKKTDVQCTKQGEWVFLYSSKYSALEESFHGLASVYTFGYTHIYENIFFYNNKIDGVNCAVV